MTRILPFLLPLGGVLACGDKDDSGADAEDPGEHACEVAGTGNAITAGATADAAAMMEIGEVGYTVSLVEGVGYVAVEVTGDTAILLFADTADVVTGLWHDGAEEALPAGEPNEFCADTLPEHFDLDLHTAGTWIIELGPSAVSSVWLLPISAEGHGHAHE